MPKAKPATEIEPIDDTEQPEVKLSSKPVLYDARAAQRIPFTITKSGRTWDVAHNIDSLSDDRYFDLQSAIETVTARSKRPTSELFFGAKQKLWKEIVTGIEGYKEREDWREKTNQIDCAGVIDILIGVSIQDGTGEGQEAADELFDDEALTTIAFHTMYAGTLLTGMSHSFRQGTKSELDEFMSIEAGETNPNALASAEKLSTAERLCRLGAKLLQDQEGYAAGSPVPAWHLAGTTRSYFLRELSRLGKS